MTPLCPDLFEIDSTNFQRDALELMHQGRVVGVRCEQKPVKIIDLRSRCLSRGRGNIKFSLIAIFNDIKPTTLLSGKYWIH